MEVLVERDPEAAAARAADLLAADVQAAVAEHGDARWVAAGGGTPAIAYGLLARRADLPWDRVTVLLGDERCVDVDDEDANWRQLAAALLDPVGVPPERRLRPPAEFGPEPGADAYERVLRELAGGDGPPRVDQAWAGVGEDGHTLSLFPGHASSAPTDRLVVPVRDAPKAPPDRVTLTLAALAGVRHLVVLATGAGKRDAVTAALAPDSALPIAEAARAVQRAGGEVTWILDEASAPVRPSG
jgi:6-phosphogluconolactonase